MSRWVAGMALVVACYRGAPSPPPPGEQAAPDAALTIRAASVGPLTATTPATLGALRGALVGFEVRPANLRFGEMQRLAYHVYRAGERLLSVMPDGHNTTIASVHAVSPKVAIADRGWRIGAPFHGIKQLSTCKCWEDGVVVCWRTGDHVAVAFLRTCSWDSFASADDRQDLIGARIQRVVWSPQPYHDGSNPFGGAAYGATED